MHPQGVNSPTFTAAPLDGSLTLPQLLDRQLAQSPHHTAYIYDAPDGRIISVSFKRYIHTVYVACRRILRNMVSCTTVTDRQRTVIGVFATTDSISHCMMVAAIMRAGLLPFSISTQNVAAGVANLLNKTGAAMVYVSADLRGILTEALEICGKQLPIFDSLTFQQLQDVEDESSNSEPLPSLPKVIDIDSVGIILQTTGSTSIMSEPVYLSHKMIQQYASFPWSGSEDHCGRIMGYHSMPHSHGMGVCMNTWPFSSGLVLAVYRPTIPPIPSTPKNALSGIIATKPDLVLATPAFIESWIQDPIGLEAIQALKGLAYAGAQLTKHVGDTLVAKGVVLCSAYGTMETGSITPFFESYGFDWDYFRVKKECNPVRVPEKDGSGLYTHTYLIGPSFTSAYTNTEIDGKPGCSVSDLLEQHPENPDLHRLYGRKDELIIFYTGLKMHPVPIETEINKNPFVDAALVFGNGRPHPGVLIQLKAQFLPQLTDNEKRSRIFESLWASVEGANKTSPARCQISRKMVLLADPQKPFALTSKFQPRRRVVFQHYEKEIRDAYLQGQLEHSRL